jgi:hypothetical protein
MDNPYNKDTVSTLSSEGWNIPDLEVEVYEEEQKNLIRELIQEKDGIRPAQGYGL